jgi:hypothetical protein
MVGTILFSLRNLLFLRIILGTRKGKVVNNCTVLFAWFNEDGLEEQDV